MDGSRVQGIVLQPWVASVVDDNVILVKSSDLQDNLLDLMDWGRLPTWSGESHV